MFELKSNKGLIIIILSKNIFDLKWNEMNSNFSVK